MKQKRLLVSSLQKASFVIVIFGILLGGFYLQGKDPTPLSKDELLKLMDETADVLSKVSDVRTARRAAPILIEWRDSILGLSPSESEKRLEQLFAEKDEEIIEEKYTKVSEQLKRVGGLDNSEVTRIIFESFFGQKMSVISANAKITSTRNLCLHIRTSLGNYFTEYRKWPWKSEFPGDMTLKTDKIFTSALKGSDEKVNPRKIPFISVPERSESEEGEIVDAWGTPFRVIYDNDYNDTVKIPAEYGVKKEIPTNVAVDSAGPDKKFETVNDNITTW